MEKYISFLLLVCSCKTATKLHNNTVLYQDIEYSGESYYEKTYIVDTIGIDNPVIVVPLDDSTYPFLTNSENLSEKAFEINSKIYNRPDVFLVSNCFYCHFNSEEMTNNYDFRNCSKTKTVSEDKKKLIYNYIHASNKFILVLMNISHFNQSNSGFHSGAFFNTELYKSTYVKVVFPLCE